MVSNTSEFPREDYYDYILVGGRTAGCPLASTLSQSHRVLVLKRGEISHEKPSMMNQEGFLNTTLEHERQQRRFACSVIRFGRWCTQYPRPRSWRKHCDQCRILQSFRSNADDVERCVYGTRKLGDVLRSRAMNDFKFRNWLGVGDFRFIGPVLPNDQMNYIEMVEFCRRNVSTIWHYPGGCVVGNTMISDPVLCNTCFSISQ